MRKHFVTFFSPGTFVSEDTTKEIESWDAAKAVEMANGIKERYNAKPYGFRFSTKLCQPDVPDGEGGKLKVLPKEVEQSGMYFLGGRLRFLEDIEKQEPGSILESNMRANDFPIVIENTNSWKSTMPFGENDFVVGPAGNIETRGDDIELVRYRQKTIERVKAERGY